MGLVGTLWPARVSPSECAIMEAPIVLTRHGSQVYRAGDRGSQVILAVLHSYSSLTCLYGLIFTRNYRLAPKIFVFKQYWIVQRLSLQGIASPFSH